MFQNAPRADLLEIILPLALIALGFALGILLERVLLRWLDRLADRTRWTGDNIFFRAIRGIGVFWGVAAGIYAATLTIDTQNPDAVAFLSILEHVLLAAVLWSLTIIAARVVAEIVGGYARRTGTKLLATSIIPNLARLGIYMLGALIVLNSIGIAITPVLTALGVGGLAIALALQETLANMFAGLYLIASREINPGDYVRLADEEEGYILDIRWRSTTIRTLLDNTVIVPNSRVTSSILTNYHIGSHRMRLRIPVPVPYDADLDQVESMVREVARQASPVDAPGARPPEVYLHTFGEFSLNMTVILPVDEFYHQYAVRHRFIKLLIERFRAEGLNFPFPIREFEMELSTQGLDADRSGGLSRPDMHASPASE